MIFSNHASVASRRLVRRSLLMSTCAVALGCVVGCEDSAARASAEAQRTVTTASTNFKNATVGTVSFGDEHFSQRQQKLQAIVSEVSNLPDADPGQQAAGAMLAGEALRELAAMELAHAREINQINRHDRTAILSLLDAASRLHGRAQAQSAISTSDGAAELQEERQAIQQALRDLQQRVAALEEPINDRTQANADAVAEVDRLRSEANDLIRRAIELGHSSGFPSYQQAISTRRDADGIDYEIALRELELTYELLPEHELAQLRAQHLQESIASIEQMLAAFDQLEAVYRSDVQTTRQRVSEFQGRIDQAMQELNSRIDGELTDRFEAARTHLQRAATQAQQAVSRLRGDKGAAARLIQAKIQESLGQSLWAEANAIAEQLQLLTQLNEASDSLGSTADAYRDARAVLSHARNELIEQAKAAFSEAERALSSAGASGTVSEYQQSLQQAITAISRQGGAGDAATMQNE